MNNSQLAAATEAMINWLAHPSELGKAPCEIECAGTFERHDMLYYIFRYKREEGGAWLVGVCGGYEEREMQHCGHVFSEMQEYNAETAENDCIAMVEMIREYWIAQAKKNPWLY